MKKLVFIIFLLFTRTFCQGQEPQAKIFFEYLQNVIEAGGPDSITMKNIEYGCLGTEIQSFVKMKKFGNLLQIEHYHYGTILTNSTYKEQVILDTSFSVSQSELIQNLKEEVLEIKTRPIIIEASYKITVEQGNSYREFRFRRGDGLYYIFRRNKLMRFPKILAPQSCAL